MRKIAGIGLALLLPAVVATEASTQAPVPAEPAYWVGDQFEGLPLTRAMAGAFGAVLDYGDCTPHSDAGCATPLQIQIRPLERRHPLQFSLVPGQSTPCRAEYVNGIPSADFGTSGSLEVYAGSSTVSIFSEPARARRAGSALRPYGAPQGSYELPAPPPHLTAALRRCDWPPGERPRRPARTPYWVGPSFAREPLVRVADVAGGVELTYGICYAVPTPAMAACAPDTRAAAFRVRTERVRRLAYPASCRAIEIRGVPAVAFGQRLDVYSGSQLVRLSGRSSAELRSGVTLLMRIDETRKRASSLPEVSRELRERLRAGCS